MIEISWNINRWEETEISNPITLTPSERNPVAWIELWWTKISPLPSSGVKKPNPFFASNHFTVPFILSEASLKKRVANADGRVVREAVMAVLAVDFARRLNMFILRVWYWGLTYLVLRRNRLWDDMNDLLRSFILLGGCRRSGHRRSCEFRILPLY